MDWVVVLAPLLLVPIVFLFAFVGCAPDEPTGLFGSGWSQPVTLHFPDGLSPDASILDFFCSIEGKPQQGSSIHRDTMSSPDFFTAPNPLTTMLHADADDISQQNQNFTIRCNASCTLLDKNNASLIAQKDGTTFFDFKGTEEWRFSLAKSPAPSGNPDHGRFFLKGGAN